MPIPNQALGGNAQQQQLGFPQNYNPAAMETGGSNIAAQPGTQQRQFTHQQMINMNQQQMHQQFQMQHMHRGAQGVVNQFVNPQQLLSQQQHLQQMQGQQGMGMNPRQVT